VWLTVIVNSAKWSNCCQLLTQTIVPVVDNFKYPETKVLANVVAGIYAPLIHGFATTVLKNIENGILPNIVIAPPRDAIPLANALKSQAKLIDSELNIIMPHINRNTAGIVNNQKNAIAQKSPLIDLLFDQTISSVKNKNGFVEIETGIYGTTSLVMAQAFKSRGVEKYIPIKFYGLGPNLSYIHAILSDGKEWIAEKAEGDGLVDKENISDLMVLLDTMEELGMENYFKSVEELQLDKNGTVVPNIIPSSDKEQEIAFVTNQVICQTAQLYKNISVDEIKLMLNKIKILENISKEGFPFTFTSTIPSMDSKEEHYNKIKKLNLFDYPKLIL
jgi:hypothetical protein